MGSLGIVVDHKRLGDLLGLLQVGGPIQRQTFLLIGSVVALHKGILLRMMRFTDLDLDAQTGSKADQGGGKIAACWAANPTQITIQRNPVGATRGG